LFYYFTEKKLYDITIQHTQQYLLVKQIPKHLPTTEFKYTMAAVASLGGGAKHPG